MSMRSCRLLSELVLLAAALVPMAAAAPASGEMPTPAGEHTRAGLIPQRPLPAVPAARALIFIGGFGDEVSGIVNQLSRRLPRVQSAVTEQRAYYHWNAGQDATPGNASPRLAEDVRAFLQVNPKADVILIAHSMGAATALRTLGHFREDEGRFFLLTLDPVDRTTRPERPPALHWWGNAYVTHSQSLRDFIPAMGGRWNACRGADVNLRFDGRFPHSGGFHPIHDDAAALLREYPAGGESSLLQQLRLHLTTEG